VSERPAAIDVLVTVYNGERFLAQTLDSVLAQTFADWRLIVVDDQSTDGTAAILADYAARDPRITVVPGPHQGIAAAATPALPTSRHRWSPGSTATTSRCPSACRSSTTSCSATRTCSPSAPRHAD
jgi:cellulose synthase/poly-beta-1,6-N-acetylglucosamine synthase-like glycosyltransferase